MKKLVIILALVFAFGSISAQKRPYRIGIKGGVNFIHLENYGGGYYSDFDPKPGYTFGALFQYKWGGFLNYSVVPEVMFTESRTHIDMLYVTDCLTTMQSVDIPVSFKLGLQLSKIFRPYVIASMYGSYVVKFYGDFWDYLDIDHTQKNSQVNKFYFGLGTGIGFDIWKFQIEGRYRWNLTTLGVDDYSSLRQMGLELTCAFLF